MKENIEILENQINNLNISEDKRNKIIAILEKIKRKSAMEFRQKNSEISIVEKGLRKSYEALLVQKKRVEHAHKHITDSINYAKTIQQALLTTRELIDSYLDDYFILFKPKEQVSGDFYYLNKIENQIIIIAADCTGHGVPGAFLTMLGITYLHEIVRRKDAENPGEALDILRQRFKRTFRTFGSENKNGLDIAFCTINLKTNLLQYAGANSPLIIIRKNELIEYKATRNPIGFYPKEKKFENNLIKLQKNDILYLFSDGFHDQFGGKHNMKFMKRKFKNLLHKIHKLPMKQQRTQLIEAYKKWKHKNQQTDDILIIGIRLNKL